MRRVVSSTLLLLLASWCHADSGEEQVPVGPRPLALGGAYVAIAEGVDALSWNSAGLSRLRVSSLRATQADLHGLGIRDNAIGFAAPLRDGLGFGFEWVHSGFDEDGLRNRFDRMMIGMGWHPIDEVSIGSSLKYRRTEQSYEDVDEGIGSGFGIDLGALVRLHPRVTIGAGWFDIGGSSLRYDDGVSVRPYDAYFSLGAAVRALPSLLVAASLDRDAHAGIEWNLLGSFDLRAGWTKDLDGLDGARLSAGLGVRYGAARLDYTFQDHPMLDPTHLVGLGVDFTLAPRLVELRELHIDPLFASFYKSYAVEAPAELVLLSLSDEAVELVVRVRQAELMREPTVVTQLLLPGVVQRVALPLLLDERIVSIDENAPRSFDVEVDYLSSGRRRSESRQLRPMVYRSGLLNWSSGVERAAAFVTPGDPELHAFTRGVLEATAGEDRVFLQNRPATLAARLFDGASASGFHYVPDPLNPYGTVQGREFAVDDIQYPAEFLRSRSGDCDDSTVLYASMLANVGIRSVLIDVPGHIYLMLDTRIPARERATLGVDPLLFVPWENSLWIPVETTQLGADFSSAWRRGAELFQEYEGSDELGLVDLQAARRRFEPIGRDAPGQIAPFEADSPAIRSLLDSDLEQFHAMRSERMRQLERDGIPTQLARVHLRYGELEAAREALESIETRDASVWNNLGTIHLAGGQSEQALEHLDRALELDPADPGIHLNRGIALHLLGDDEQAALEFQHVVRVSAGLPGAFDLLSLQPGVDQEARAIDVLAVEELALRSVESQMRQAARAIDAQESALLNPGDAEASQLAAAADSTVSTGDRVIVADVDDRVVAANELTVREAQVTPQSYAEILYWKERSRP